jgi:hypothetical protein
MEEGREPMRLVLIQMNSRTAARDELLVQASGTDEQLISADIDRKTVVRARRTFFLFRDRRPDAYGPIVRATKELHAEPGESTKVPVNSPG